MIYTFRCSGCGERQEFLLPLASFDELRDSAWCSVCQKQAKVVITGGRTIFVRSPFPKGYHEHISPDGAYIRDKKEAIDVAAENGLTSVYCENDM